MVLSEVLKSELLKAHFEWDGNRTFHKNQEVTVGGGQFIVINGQAMQQPPRRGHLKLTVEDYGQSCITDVDETNAQMFNLISFSRELTLDGGDLPEQSETVLSFWESEENKLLHSIQSFLGGN